MRQDPEEDDEQVEEGPDTPIYVPVPTPEEQSEPGVN